MRESEVWPLALLVLLVLFVAVLLVVTAPATGGGMRSPAWKPSTLTASQASPLIAFTRADGIYVMREDGTGVRALRRGLVASNLDWSPDGRRLAFESGAGLWVMDADGTDLARLVAPLDVDGWEGGVHSPSWSPNGRRIAFSIGIRCCSKPRYETVKGIWVVNADGSSLRRLLRLPGLGPDTGVGSVDWSPDGRRFAFTAHSGWVAWVYVVNVDGTNLRRVTGRPGGVPWAVDPEWSPDSRRIVFEQWPLPPSRRVGPWSGEIYVMTLAGGSQRRLTRNTDPDSAPVWSPDGRTIAFVRNEHCPSCPPSPRSEILVMNADGTGVTNLTHNQVGDRSPAWQPSPDT